MWSFIAKTVSLTQQEYKSLTVHQKISVNGYIFTAKQPQLSAFSHLTFSTLYYNYSIADCLSRL